ncbi:MAG: NADPH-dependent 7-cyano-7-deazaguanine reductase QueF [Porticoccaceae bacterium]
MTDLSTAPIGQKTGYPSQYSPELLYPVDRAEARARLAGYQAGCFFGYDEWNLYELAWLDSQGSPQVGMGRLQVPATTTNIVESKSLKLYANSLFYKRFSSSIELTHMVESDLGNILGGNVIFRVLSLDEGFPSSKPEDGHSYANLDRYSLAPPNEIDINKIDVVGSPEETNRYSFHRFRSLCPVTGQPDWASVFIRMDGVGVKNDSLAQYLLSYAEHQGFHENCVEAIFCELNNYLRPEALSVAARFTRRGGIDINPVRATSADVLEMPPRQIRQ